MGLLALGLFGGISLRIGWLPWSSPLWGLFAGIVVFVGMMVGRMVAVQAKYSCLVITPDGFVQRTGRSARSIFAVAYRDLAGMKIDVDARKRPRHNCSPVYDQHYARQVKITLRLFLSYPDQHTRVWQPDKRFGDSMEIVPFLNEGYVRHFALKRVKHPLPLD